jgi:hypothetical protein
MSVDISPPIPVKGSDAVHLPRRPFLEQSNMRTSFGLIVAPNQHTPAFPSTIRFTSCTPREQQENPNA